MKPILLLLLAFISFSSIGQHLVFPDCEPSKKASFIFVNVANPAKYSDSYSSLEKKFETYFKRQFGNSKHSGSMMISIFIDSVGNYCCSQIDNLSSDAAIDFEDFKTYINSNLIWKPAIQNNKDVSSIKRIMISFDKRKVNIKEQN